MTDQYTAGMRRAAEICAAMAQERAEKAIEVLSESARSQEASAEAALNYASDAILAAIHARATAQCCMCGKRGLSTVEDGGPECELHDGRWVCSRECYDRAIPPAEPWAAPPEAERQEGFDTLIADAKAEAAKAMRKFPQPNYVISKVAEEAGEVVKAAIHCAEGRGDVAELRGEMKQLIAMLYRLWVEGDGVHGLPPVAPLPPAPEEQP